MLFSFTSRAISSSTSAIPGSLLRRGRAQRQRVNLRHEGAEDPVDHLVLLDKRLAGEGRGPHPHLEVVAGAGRVLDLDLGAGQRRLDATADLVGARHPHTSMGWYTLATGDASAGASAPGARVRLARAEILQVQEGDRAAAGELGQGAVPAVDRLVLDEERRERLLEGAGRLGLRLGL